MLKYKLIDSTLRYYKRLTRNGLVEKNTKKDILALLFLDEILRESCYYDLFNEEKLNKFVKAINKISRDNNQIVNLRVCLNDYKNLGGNQNFDTFRNFSKKL